jgi:uncharacterized protein (DUF3820 family)
MDENIFSNTEDLFKLVKTRMPYGKYQGVRLIDLPEPYVVWYFGEGRMRRKKPIGGGAYFMLLRS